LTLKPKIFSDKSVQYTNQYKSVLSRIAFGLSSVYRWLGSGGRCWHCGGGYCLV